MGKICHDCLEDRPCSCDRISEALSSRRGKVRLLYRQEHLDAAVAKAVEAEREACAKICDETANNWREAAKESDTAERTVLVATTHAKLIRARGAKT